MAYRYLRNVHFAMVLVSYNSIPSVVSSIQGIFCKGWCSVHSGVLISEKASSLNTSSGRDVSLPLEKTETGSVQLTITLIADSQLSSDDVEQCTGLHAGI